MSNSFRPPDSSSNFGARTLVIYNPTAGPGRQRRLRDGLERLVSSGQAVDVRPTRCAGDAERLAREAPGDYGALVVAGGDGTINEAVNGLLRRPNGRPLLGILPLGTANVLALELGLPLKPAAAAAVIGAGRRAAIRPGCANGRYFTMMAGVGFDAHVVEGVRPQVKRWLGKGAYGLEIGRQLLGYRDRRYRISIGEARFEAATAIVAKGRYYGGPFVLAPQASPFLDSLQVCLFGRGGRGAVLRMLLALGTGRIGRQGDVRFVAADRLSIEGAGPEPVQADGDIIARLPVEVSLAETSLQVLVG